MLPIEAAGTIHIDAYICRQSSDSSLEEERNARRKVIRYFRRRGIDVTTEFLYRFPGMDQGKLPKEIAKQQADDLIGLVPMIWWLNQEQEDYIKRPVSLICGGRYNEDLNTCGFEGLGFLTGNGVHGDVYKRQWWHSGRSWAVMKLHRKSSSQQNKLTQK